MRSAHAHADIRAIDVAVPRAVPGVVAVLTGGDVNGEIGMIHTHVPSQAFDTMNQQGRTLLADGRVRHVGEAVSVVLAETLGAAADAADAVVVDSPSTRAASC